MSAQQVALLNASYEPLGKVTFQHAVRMLFREVALVEEQHGDRMIGPHPWPRVIRLVRYVTAHWLHREHQHDEGTEERALVQSLVDLYSYVYAAEADAVRPAAQARVDAMDLSDLWVDAGCRPDDPLLAQERAALVASYTALRHAV